MKQIAVFGMGYVGCVTAGCLSRDGHHVIGVDIDTGKVAALNGGTSPVAEPGLQELVKAQVAAGRLEATTDLADAIRRSDMALIAVGTPSAHDGSVETRAVERVLESIAAVLNDGVLSQRDADNPYTIVLRSTLLPGILEERLLPILAAALPDELGTRLRVCNHPEFLRETTAIRDYDNPPFIVVGAEVPEHADAVFGLYDRIEAKRIVTDPRTAALVKYACNAFHALKVAFGNEIGTLAREFGGSGHEVMRIVCEDKSLNISPAYLRPGFAFGGSCLPKDVRALTRFAQQKAVATDLLSSILPSNESHLNRALKMIREQGSRRIGLIGLSFKAGTDDLRESPQVILAETLLGRGYELKIYDPDVRITKLLGKNLTYVDLHLPHLAALLTEDPADVLEHAELLVIGTDVANDLDLDQRYFGEVIDLRRDLVNATPNMAKTQ